MEVSISKEEKDIWESFNLDWMKDLMWGTKGEPTLTEEDFHIAWVEVNGVRTCAAVSKNLQKAFEVDVPYIKSDREILTFTFERWFRGMDF